MAEKIENMIAARLRVIAQQVRDWEMRDLKAEGKTRRPGYDIDLREIAAMLEGRHVEHRLDRKPAQAGRPRTLANVERDLAIAQFVDKYRKAPGSTVAQGIAAASAHFNLSSKAIDAAQRRMRYALEPGNETIVPFFERLAARGYVKITRLRTPKKPPPNK